MKYVTMFLVIAVEIMGFLSMLLAVFSVVLGEPTETVMLYLIFGFVAMGYAKLIELIERTEK